MRKSGEFPGSTCASHVVSDAPVADIGGLGAARALNPVREGCVRSPN
jgi:hypothetical protein